MAQNFDKFSLEEAKRLAQSEPGQKLLTLLQSQDAQTLHTAMNQASSGNYEQLRKTLGTLMSSPEARMLLNQLEHGKHE